MIIQKADGTIFEFSLWIHIWRQFYRASLVGESMLCYNFWRFPDLPEWRNWQTRWTQNPVLGDQSVGSTPSSGTSFSLIVPKFSLNTASILIPFFQR
jgi:hypothetical protein